MSSEEEEQGQMKSADSASAKSDDLKSEVSDPNFVLVSVRASCNFTVSIIIIFFPLLPVSGITRLQQQLLLETNISFIRPEGH